MSSSTNTLDHTHPHDFDVSCDARACVTELTVRGELDVVSAPSLIRAALPWTHCPDRTLLIDLTDVTFIDASGLSALLALRGEDAAHRLELRTSACVDRLLVLTSLRSRFSVVSAGLDLGRC